MYIGLGNLLTKGGFVSVFPNKYSFNFDGNGDYLDCGASNVLVTGTNVTLSCWFKVDGTSRGYLIQNQKGAGSTNLTIQVNSNDSSETAGYVGAIIWRGTGHDFISFDGDVDDGAWHHLALTTTSSAQVLYLDGTSVATGSTTFTNASSTDSTLIGNDGQSNYDFDGLIDEVAIWDTTLSADDVAKIASKPVDFSKASTYATDRTSNLKLWLRCGDKAEPESTTAIARQDFYTDFDGTDDYVDCGADVHDFSSGNFTILGWVYHDTGNTDHAGIVGVRDSTNTELQFYINSSNNTLASWNGSGNVYSTSAIADEVWTHVGLVQSGSNKKFYINGVLDNTASQANGTARPATFKIGYTGDGNEYFLGSISNISAYKTELDAQTISQMSKSRFVPVRDNRFSVVDFDGTDDRIDVSVTLSNATYTVMGWVYKTRQDGAYFADFRKDSGTGYFAFGNNSNNSIYTQSGTLYVNGVIGTTVPLNAWTHICVTGMTIESSTIKIACQNNDTNFFQGSYSSVSIYSGTKSAEEVYAIYQQGITYDESSLSGLVGYWRMGDDTSKAYPTIADSSSNSNDGTASGAVETQQMVAGYDLGAFESSSEELGGEEVVNGTFDSNVNDWDVYQVSRGDLTWSSGRARIDNTTGTGNQFLRQRNQGRVFKQGVIYKVQFDHHVISEGSNGSSRLNFYWDSNQLIDVYDTTNKQGDTWTIYSAPNADKSHFLIGGFYLGDIYELDNITIKEVLQSEVSDTFPFIADVNEPVLGAELITSNTTSDWTTYAGNSEANVTDGVSITVPSSGGDSRGSYYSISGLTSGNIYKAVFQAYTSNASDNNARFYIDSHQTDFLTTTQTTYTIYFDADSSNELQMSGIDANSIIYIQNFSVKEVLGNVGTMTNQDSADLVYSSVLPDQSFLTGANSAYNFIDLDGSDEFIVSNSNIGISGSNAYTMNCWFKLDSYGSFPVLMSSGEISAYKENTFLIRTDHNTVGWGNQVSGNDFANDSGTTISLNTWYMATFTFNGSDTIKIYVNGALDGTKSVSSVNITNSVLYIGKRSNGLFLDGQITQCSVFNKTLSATEVSAIYNLGRHSNLLDSYSDNLLGYFAMSALDAKTGLSDVGDGTIYDRSGNSNHGTATNTESADLKSSPNAEPNGYAKGDTNRSTTTP